MTHYIVHLNLYNIVQQLQFKKKKDRVKETELKPSIPVGNNSQTLSRRVKPKAPSYWRWEIIQNH